MTVRASAAVDSTGWYRVALPIGQYGIEFDTDINYLYSSGIVDTMTVGRTVRRKDFPLGRASRFPWRSVRVRRHQKQNRCLPPGNFAPNRR
ncbi:MAG: hypothetical protein IPI48_11910 [bacterium]|nr:hypothetical protein [bacterium]